MHPSKWTPLPPPPSPPPPPLTAEAFAGNFPLFDEQKGRRYRGLWRLLHAGEWTGVFSNEVDWVEQDSSRFLYRVISYETVFFLFVFQILIYIFKLILLTINPLLLAFRILYLSEICSLLREWNTKIALNRPKRFKTAWDSDKQHRIQQGNKVSRFYLNT